VNGADFLRGVVAAFPYAIHTVLTGNGMALADLPKNRNGLRGRHLGAHVFDPVCDKNGIGHRPTKPYHPWTNRQAERMNRTFKKVTIKAFLYQTSKASKHKSLLSYQYTISPSASKRSGGKHHSKPSAMPGRPHPRSSKLTRVTSSQDQMVKFKASVAAQKQATPFVGCKVAPAKRVRVAEQFHLMLGVPNQPLGAIAQLLQRRVERGESRIYPAVVALHQRDGRHRRRRRRP